MKPNTTTSNTQLNNDPHKHLSIYQLLVSQAKQRSDTIAILAPNRLPLTYKALIKHINYIVDALNTIGVRRNDRIAIAIQNDVDLAIAVLGIACGATSAPLNPNYTKEEFKFYLSDLKAKILITQTNTNLPAVDVAKELNIPIIRLSSIPESEAGIFNLITNTEIIPKRQREVAESEDIAIILHTSGTTSRPKIVPLTHINICSSAYNSKVALKLDEADRCLNVMPFFHVHGLISATLASLSAGSSVICTPGFNENEFLNWIKDFHPTWYTASPTIHQSILTLTRSEYQKDKYYSLRFIRSSSSPLPPQVMEELERTFDIPVIEYYGMTEASSQITCNPMPPQQRKKGSAGIAAGPEVVIMDKSGNLLSSNQTGEIVIRGINIMKGYEDNPAANMDSFINDWFKTGEEGFLDEHGYLFITGRSKEIINRGGEKISPREIDEALMEHPAIAKAVAFAVPHITLGEDIAIAIVLREGSIVNKREIREFAFMRLAAHKVPSQILIVKEQEIPKSPTGKLQRVGLVKKFKSQLKEKFEPPRNNVEISLAKIWSEVLSIDEIGIHDNFFMLGGDSLLAVKIISRINSAFFTNLSLEILFKEPTIAELAVVIEEKILEEIERSD